MPELILATSNPAKLTELRRLLEGTGWAVRAQSDLGIDAIPETGTTFVENAILKARHAARRGGGAALADDSGLEVDVLGGAPGVRSARFAGEGARDADNVALLLEHLRDVPPPERTARFRCVLVVVRHAEDPAPLICQGTWEGAIASRPRGAAGFGYDPVFLPAGSARTAAELSPAEKDRASHRGQALRTLRAALAGLRPPGSPGQSGRKRP